MEIILIHKARGIFSPELLKTNIEFGKTIKPGASKAVPGGNLVSSYMARGKMLIFCVWDVPKIESLTLLLEQMTLLGWDTEVIPVEKSQDATRDLEKVLAEMTKK